jgi:hypothetical protein
MKENIKKAKKGNFFGVSGTLELLEKQLQENEIPLIIVQGIFEDKSGILAATSKRVLAIAKFFFSSTSKDVPYEKITSVMLDNGIIQSKIKIEYSGGKIEVNSIDKDAAKQMVELINAKKSEKEKSDSVSQNNDDDVYEKLKKLGHLRDIGVLTEQEFIEQKNKLLGSI